MAEIMLSVNTTVEIPVTSFPLIDDTDFKTIRSLAYNAPGLDLRWNFISSSGVITVTQVTPAPSGDYTWTDYGTGIIKIRIPAAGGLSVNNNTTGFGWFTGVATGVTPWRGPFVQFAPANVAASLGSGAQILSSNLMQLNGDVLSMLNLRDFTDTGYNATTHKVQSVASTDTVVDKANYTLTAAYDPAKTASTQASVDLVYNAISNLSLKRRLTTSIPRVTFRPNVGDKYFKVDVLLYDENGLSFDPPDTTDYNARFSVDSVDGGGVILTASISGGNAGRGYVATQVINDTALFSGTPGGAGAIFTVDTVDGNGAILTFTVTNGGTGYHATDVLKSSSHRPNYNYDGLGFIAAGEQDTAFVCYSDNIGTPLSTSAICHHTLQTNPPQILRRTSQGVYYFWIKVSFNTTLETVNFLFGWFDVVADPINHIKELYQMTIDDASVVESIKTTVDLIHGTDIPALPQQTSDAVWVDPNRDIPAVDVTAVTYNPDGTRNVITLANGHTITMGYTGGALTSVTYA